MSDELSAEEEEVLKQLFAGNKPQHLEPGWEPGLRQAIAESQGKANVVPLERSPLDAKELDHNRGRPIGQLLQIAAVVFLVVGASIAGWLAFSQDTEEKIEVTGPLILVSDARITVRSERDQVTVNNVELASGLFQGGSPGDIVETVGEGSATITVESVLEVEALRGAKVSVPELSSLPLALGLEVGHVFVRLNPAAAVAVAVDTGERRFTTLTPDTEFAVCQTPDGASCLAVFSGQVKWSEDGIAEEVYEAGQGTFGTRGAAPEPVRCGDQAAVSELQRSLRGVDFAGALADIVATWEPCGVNDGADFVNNTVTIPSIAGMEHVVLPEIVVGSPDEDLRTLDGTADYYIDPRSVTNAGLRTWLVNVAGDDAGTWREFAPSDWLDLAPGGNATQAIYTQGTADEAVKGVAYSAAEAYCAAQAKRLATEIEWELAAVNGIIEDLDDESHDWVSDWESYGPGPEDTTDRQVLRGTNDLLVADPYFRIFALDTPDATAGRQNARIRCAADEVAIGGRSFDNVVFSDDFNSPEWPQVDEDFFELDYHPENYHLDLTQSHSQATVVRALPDSFQNGRIDVDLFIERNSTGTDDGAYRFGTVFGTTDQLYTLTIQPDNFTDDRFTACVLPISEELTAELALNQVELPPEDSGRHASFTPGEGHYGQDCVEAETSVDVEVANIDSPVRLTVVLDNGQLEAWVNDVLVETNTNLSSISTYGFYTQLYHRDRSHIHYDDVIVSTS